MHRASEVDSLADLAEIVEVGDVFSQDAFSRNPSYADLTMLSPATSYKDLWQLSVEASASGGSRLDLSDYVQRVHP